MEDIFEDGDLECVKELLNPAEAVIGGKDMLCYEMREERVKMWNGVWANYKKYLAGECKRFLPDLDRAYKSKFEVALLLLARCFKQNGEKFPPAEMFMDKEIDAFSELEKYEVFEIYTKNDLKKKIIGRDESLLALFRNYYLYMDKWMDEVLEDSNVKLGIRYYMKQKWEKYKKKLNEALSELITELDWFRVLVSQWEKEAENYASMKAEDIRAKVMEEATRAIEEERKKVETAIKEVEKRVKEAEERAEKERKKAEVAIKEVEERAKELEMKEKAIRKAMEEIRGAKSEGSRFVELGRVKQYEMNFIGRIERKLGKEIELFGKKFKVEYRECETVDTSVYAGRRGFVVFGEVEVKNLPENRYIDAEIVEKKLIGEKKRFRFKAIFVARVERYVDRGFDTDPMTLEEVNAYLVKARDEAKRLGYTVVLCLASPTGFSDEVLKHLNSDEFYRNFMSRYLSVVLVDVERNFVVFNRHDEVAKEFSKFCEMEMDVEKKERIKKCVEGLMEGRDWVVLEDALKCGDESIARAVFYELAGERGWNVRYVEGVGLVLMRCQDG